MIPFANIMTGNQEPIMLWLAARLRVAKIPSMVPGSRHRMT
jgi:hypothetical protein